MGTDRADAARSALLEAMPDLVVLMRRDGVLLSAAGGRDVAGLIPSPGSDGRRLDAIWPAHVVECIHPLIRRAIERRGTVGREFESSGCRFEARVTALNPQRTICVIRRIADEAPEKPLNRRGFRRRLSDSISTAALKESALSLALVRVHGVMDTSRSLDSDVARQILSIAVGRLTHTESWRAGPAWYLGPLDDDLLAVVVESADRGAIEACLSRICVALHEPVGYGDAVFNLTTDVGVAILRQDASTPKALLNHAHSALVEAQRGRSSVIGFFSDTLKLRTLARLDMVKELREAIARRDIRLRYAARHDLDSGRLVALVGYLHWVNPLRGKVRPAEFLGIAETTGLSASLSRSIFECLEDDYAMLAPMLDGGVRLSVGALRHHVLSGDFQADISRFIAAGRIPAERLELRIAERSYVAADAGLWRGLSDIGVSFVVDEVGRGMSSLDRLARVPLAGLQLDRSLLSALRSDAEAIKVCRAIVNVALTLGVTPIATGIDDAGCRDALRALGCRQGLGDLYGTPAWAESAPVYLRQRASNQ